MSRTEANHPDRGGMMEPETAKTILNGGVGAVIASVIAAIVYWGMKWRKQSHELAATDKEQDHKQGEESADKDQARKQQSREETRKEYAELYRIVLERLESVEGELKAKNKEIAELIVDHHKEMARLVVQHHKEMSAVMIRVAQLEAILEANGIQVKDGSSVHRPLRIEGEGDGS